MRYPWLVACIAAAALAGCGRGGQDEASTDASNSQGLTIRTDAAPGPGAYPKARDKLAVLPDGVAAMGAAQSAAPPATAPSTAPASAPPPQAVTLQDCRHALGQGDPLADTGPCQALLDPDNAPLDRGLVNACRLAKRDNDPFADTGQCRTLMGW